MDKPIISSFSPVTDILIQNYERYLPNAFDESMSILEKVNKVIYQLNQVGEISNSVVAQWNSIMQWITENGIDDSTLLNLHNLIDDGTIGNLINTNLLGAINDKIANFLNNYSVSIKQFGAVGDSVTDDTEAFKSLATYLNNQSEKSCVLFPSGTYVLKEPIQFNNEVTLIGCENAWIDYSGLGRMFTLGKLSISSSDFQNYKHFEVKTLGFKNGLNMSHGIYFSDYVTQPRVTGCNFENFGNPTAWGVYFGNDCWDGIIQDCRWDSTNDGIAKNFISMYGRGNSRVRVLDNLITSLVGDGTAIYLNGFNNVISRNKIEGFKTNVRLGGLASGSQVIENYFEKAGVNSGCIEIGSISGDNGDTSTPIGIIIDKNYCNTHLVDLSNPSYFIKPTKSTDLIKQMTVSNNYVNSWNVGNYQTELIYQNNLAGQTDNVAYGNTLLNISRINTIGTNILHWNGDQDTRLTYNPLAEEDRYQDMNMGRTQNNNAYQRIKKYDGSVLYQLQCDTFLNTKVYNNGNLCYQMFPDGRMGFGLSTINAKYDFNGDVRAMYFRINSQKTGATVENGSVYEDSDGKLKYKNLAGTIVDLTL